MNAKQANQVSIKSYLESIGIKPTKSYKSYSLYCSPYRADRSPSLKISHQENLWIDYGDDNTGGTLIDLVLKIHPGLKVSEAIKEIERSSQLFFSFHQQRSSVTNNTKQETGKVKPEKGKKKSEIRNPKHEKAITENGIGITGATKNGIAISGTAKQEYLTRTGTINIYKLQGLGNNPAITAYLKSRGIQISTAGPYCKEVYYTLNSKQYFGLGNQNDRGWSIRNKYWKGCTAQGYSYYKRGLDRLCVFEGIFDLLSFIALNKDNSIQANFLVLNSLVNLKRAMPIIERYFQVNLFLDHDQAGRNATKVLLELLPNSRDASSFYSSFKDLNDYHLAKDKEQLVVVKDQLLKDNCSPCVYEASHVLARPKRLLRLSLRKVSIHFVHRLIWPDQQ